VLQRIPTITTIAAARAAAEGIEALQQRQITTYPLQQLHSQRLAAR
jgi:carbamoyl-phosphate synthase large subunit